MLWDLNLIAVLTAVAASLTFMFIWYGILGDLWARLAIESTRGNIGEFRLLSWVFIVNFISVSVLYILLYVTWKTTLIDAIEFWYLIWIGFVVPFALWEVISKNGSIWATFIELWAFLGQIISAAFVLSLFF